jgi:hypothetical protein
MFYTLYAEFQSKDSLYYTQNNVIDQRFACDELFTQTPMQAANSSVSRMRWPGKLRNGHHRFECSH